MDFILTNASGIHAIPISEHIFAMLLAFVAMLAIGVVLGVVSVASNTDPEGFIFNLLFGVIGSLAAPLFQVPAVLLYYDMRARKEHFDGAALAQELMM